MNKQGKLMYVFITLGVIVGVLLLAGFILIGSVASAYNKLVATDVDVENHWGKVQSAYERRADLLPNLAETVKGSAEFEKEVQTKVAEFRGGIRSARTPADLEAVDQQMTAFVTGPILGYVEQYPQLKSTEAFRALMDEIAGTENRIKWERDEYNNAVANYKLTVRTFPTSMIAGFFNFSPEKWSVFEAKTSAQDAPQLSFD